MQKGGKIIFEMGTKYEFAFLYLEPDYFMLFLDLKACCQFILDFKKNIIF